MRDHLLQARIKDGAHRCRLEDKPRLHAKCDRPPNVMFHWICEMSICDDIYPTLIIPFFTDFCCCTLPSWYSSLLLRLFLLLLPLLRFPRTFSSKIKFWWGLEHANITFADQGYNSSPIHKHNQHSRNRTLLIPTIIVLIQMIILF